ncbi:MAG: histidine phosphatase family protein [Tahibacter sp.]
MSAKGQNTTRIDLLRHGDTAQQSYRGQLDDTLSELGWRQLRQATADGAWDWIVTSSLRRCAEFAQCYAEETALTCSIDPRLIEYHFGEWQGRTLDSLVISEPDAVARLRADPGRYPPPHAEKFSSFGERLRAAIDRIVDHANGRHVLVVTHGAVIRWLLCAAHGWPFGAMAEIDVPHASLHKLDWSTPSPATSPRRA